MIDAGLGYELLLDEAAIGLAFDPERVDGPGADDKHGLSERSIQALRPVLRDPDAQTSLKILYRMYRNMGTANPGERELAREYGCRYDISVFGHGLIGAEYFKTSGHYHPGTVSNPRISYPEIYEVLHGQAVFLLQKVADPSDIYAPPGETVLEDAILLIVEEGEHAVMPPNYGHVMYNLTQRPVVTSNWVSSLFSSFYKPFERAQGAAYYLLDGLKIEPNPRMGSPVPEPKWMRPVQDLPELGLRHKHPLYPSFFQEPEQFIYVSQPSERPACQDLELLFQPSDPPEV